MHYRGRRRLLLRWAKAEKDIESSRKFTRSEGDNLEESATRALMRHGGTDMVGEMKCEDGLGVRVACRRARGERDRALIVANIF